MATISAGDIALTTSFDAECFDSHTAHTDSQTVSTDYRLPVWGAWNTGQGGTAPDNRLGAFLIKNSYKTDQHIATVIVDSADYNSGSNPRLCFDFLEIDSAATINSLTYKIVCKSTLSDLFVRVGDFTNTLTYTSTSQLIGPSKTEYTFTVPISDTIRQTGVDGYGIWAELDTSSSNLDLDVYHISARVNYTGRTRSKTEAIIKPFSAANTDIDNKQWGTKGYGFSGRMPANSSIRNIRTQFGFMGGQLSRTDAGLGLFYTLNAYDANVNYMYYHTDSLGLLTTSGTAIDTSSIELGVPNIKLWNHIPWNRTLNQNREYGIDPKGDFITTQPTESDTSNGSRIKTPDASIVSNRYPSLIEDNIPVSGTGKQGWHIPEEVVVWDYGNRTGLTYSEVIDSNFGVGGNHIYDSQNDPQGGTGGYVAYSNEYNGTYNQWRATATEFDCEIGTNTCSNYTADSTKGHFKGFGGTGAQFIGGYAIVQIAYQTPLFVEDFGLTTSFGVSIPADGVSVEHQAESDLAADVAVTALGGFLILDEGIDNISTNIDLTNTGLAGLVFAGESDLDLDFDTTFSALLATTAESDLAISFSTEVSASNSIVPLDIPTYSSQIDLENTGLAGRIRTGFTIDPTTQIDIADLAENGVFLLQQPPAKFVYTTDSATRTITIPLQGEDRAHERHLYIDQQTRVIVIPLQGEDRAHERHLYIDQQTRTITAEALDE